MITHNPAVLTNLSKCEAPRKPLHVLFEEQVNVNPQKCAMERGDSKLTYHELNNAANQLVLTINNVTFFLALMW